MGKQDDQIEWLKGQLDLCHRNLGAVEKNGASGKERLRSRLRQRIALYIAELNRLDFLSNARKGPR